MLQRISNNQRPSLLLPVCNMSAFITYFVKGDVFSKHSIEPCPNNLISFVIDALFVAMFVPELLNPSPTILICAFSLNVIVTLSVVLKYNTSSFFSRFQSRCRFSDSVPDRLHARLFQNFLQFYVL